MRFLSPKYALKEFPNDNGLWKVDWFGDLLPYPNARSESLLEVFIVLQYEDTEEIEELNKALPNLF